MRSPLAPPTFLAAAIVSAALALGDATDAAALESSLPIVVLDPETAIPDACAGWTVRCAHRADP